MMGDEFVECVRLSQEKNDLSFMIKVNGLKVKLAKMKEGIASLEEAIAGQQNKKLNQLTN